MGMRERKKLLQRGRLREVNRDKVEAVKILQGNPKVNQYLSECCYLNVNTSHIKFDYPSWAQRIQASDWSRIVQYHGQKL